MPQVRPIKIQDGRRRYFANGDTVDPAVLGTGERTGAKILRDDGSWVSQGGGGYDGDPSIIQQTANYRLTNDTEKSTWNGKQNALGFIPVNTNDARLSDARTPVAHSHPYAADNHNHSGVYSPVLGEMITM